MTPLELLPPSSDKKQDDTEQQQQQQQQPLPLSVLPFTPPPSWTLVSQGAEARIWKIPNYFPNNIPAICKERFVKTYRHPVLDHRLNKQRCKLEGKCMMKGRKGGVPTPTIYGVHSPLLFMEFMHGITVREWLEQQQQQQRLVSSDNNTDDSAIDVVVVSTTTTTTTQTYKTVAETIGRLVATLHNTGTIHGDLTTSNMMFNDMDNNDTMQLHMIDFGLARGSTTNPEEMAVDLYVLERAILSTHPEVEHIGFTEDILKSYKATCCKSDAVLQRLSQVRLRGRKRECFG